MAQTSFRSIVSIALVLVVACFGVGYFITTPQWSKYSLGKDQLAKMQSDNLQLAAALASVQTFLDSYQAHNKDAATVSLALPLKSSDLANFAASVGDLAKSSGVVLSNVAVQEASAAATKAGSNNSIQVVPLNLSASGTYASFRDFMVRLQAHLRIVDVGHVTLKSDENGLLQYQINLQTYYQK